MSKDTTTAEAAVAPVATETTEVTETKKSTAKSKAALGVPENYIITWVPLDLAPEQNETVQRVAAARSTDDKKVKVADILRDMLRSAITDKFGEGAEWTEEAKLAPVPKSRAAVIDLDNLPADADEAEALLKKAEAKAQKQANAAATAAENARKAIEAARKAREARGGSAVTTANDASDGAVV